MSLAGVNLASSSNIQLTVVVVVVLVLFVASLIPVVFVCRKWHQKRKVSSSHPFNCPTVAPPASSAEQTKSLELLKATHVLYILVSMLHHARSHIFVRRIIANMTRLGAGRIRSIVQWYLTKLFLLLFLIK